jgi:hypothetical protein
MCCCFFSQLLFIEDNFLFFCFFFLSICKSNIPLTSVIMNLNCLFTYIRSGSVSHYFPVGSQKLFFSRTGFVYVKNLNNSENSSISQLCFLLSRNECTSIIIVFFTVVSLKQFMVARQYKLSCI